MLRPGRPRAYTGLDDDELIGVLGAWQKTEAWAAAGRLSAVAELIRRRPGETSGAPGAGDSPCPGPRVSERLCWGVIEISVSAGHGGDLNVGRSK
jgi:hypothetical protein